MAKRRLEPNTVLYPVPVVFLTSGVDLPDGLARPIEMLKVAV